MERSQRVHLRTLLGSHSASGHLCLRPRGGRSAETFLIWRDAQGRNTAPEPGQHGHGSLGARSLLDPGTFGSLKHFDFVVATKSKLQVCSA